jgi:hypothetical protein
LNPLASGSVKTILTLLNHRELAGGLVDVEVGLSIYLFDVFPQRFQCCLEHPDPSVPIFINLGDVLNMVVGILEFFLELMNFLPLVIDLEHARVDVLRRDVGYQ